MTLRHQRTPTQVCRANFDCNAQKKYYRGRYTRAFKEATIELSNNQANEEMRGKRGYGAQAIAEKVNTSMLSSPNDHKLSATSLQRAIESKRAGQLPSKLGRPERIPFQLVAALAKQSAMTQVASEGEASGKKIKALTEGLVTGTKWESVFSTEYCWKRTRSQHSDILNLVRAKINEDRRVEWLTYKNINDWTAAAKKFLIAIGMAKDEPGIIREYLALYSIEQEHHQSRDELADLGFNADILDLQPKVAENHPIPADEEGAIEALMKNGGANKAGSLFRVGISVVNCRVVLETLRRTKEQAEKVKEQKEKSQQVVEDGKVKAALEAFGKWCGNGMKLDGESHTVMTRTCAVAIVKVLMPAVAPTLKVSDFTTLKSCTKWLGELAGGTTWVDEMMAIMERNELEEVQPTELFGA